MITVNKALKRGNIIVSIPVLFITYGVMGIGFLLWATESVSFYSALAFILSGHLLGWLYWSFAITRWRIWAFSAVDDVHELKTRAIANKLILPDGHIFGKIEIQTKRDKELLKSLETKFNDPPKAKPVLADSTIPPITRVFYSSRIGLFLIGSVASIALVSCSIYLLVNSDRWSLAASLFLAGIYIAFDAFRNLQNSKPQVILDDKGIIIKDEPYLWSDIKDVTITHSSNTWLTLNTNQGEVNTTIDDLEISGFELKDKINIYQLRFMKATASTPPKFHDASLNERVF